MTLDDDVQIDVFLKGEFPAGFRKLANSTAGVFAIIERQERFKNSLPFYFSGRKNAGNTNAYGDSLVSLGAVPINLTVQKKAGESSNIIFPVAVMHYKGKQSLVNLYPGSKWKNFTGRDQ